LLRVVCVFDLSLAKKCFRFIGAHFALPCLIIQYVKHVHYRDHHGFELYPVILGVVIVWVFAEILTVAGAYDHASQLGQRNCRTDRLGLVTAAPW